MPALPVTSAFGLLLQLEKIVGTALADLRMATPPANASAEPGLDVAKIYVGGLPMRTAGDAARPPFVVLQAMSGHDTGVMHEITVAVRFALYGGRDPREAEATLHAAVSAVILAIKRLPGNVTPDGAFRLDLTNGLPWERPDTQGEPFVEAFLTTVWQTRAATETTVFV